MKKILLFFSFILIPSYLVYYFQAPEKLGSNKLHYLFQLESSKTSFESGSYISIKGKLALTYLKQGKGLLLEFDQVEGIYGTDQSNKGLKDFFSKNLKRPILIRKDKKGLLEIISPKNNSGALNLFLQITYYLTFPFPQQAKMSHPSPFGPSNLFYKQGKNNYYNILRKSPFHGTEIINGTFKSLFDSTGSLKYLTGLDENFKSLGNRVVAKSKMKLSFTLQSIQKIHHSNIPKGMPEKI